MGQVQPRVIIWTNLVVFEHPMLHTKFQGHQRFGSGEEDFFKGFYHIWAWQPSWSCDQDCLNKLSFPHPMETLYEIWLQSAQRFLRRCLKMLTTYTHTHTHTYGRQRPTYTEPNGSGGLKADIYIYIIIIIIIIINRGKYGLCLVTDFVANKTCILNSVYQWQLYTQQTMARYPGPSNDSKPLDQENPQPVIPELGDASGDGWFSVHSVAERRIHHTIQFCHRPDLKLLYNSIRNAIWLHLNI